MFGYDDDELERATEDAPINRGMFGYSAATLNRWRGRRRRWLGRLIIAAELLVLVVGLLAAGLAWLVTTPEGLRLALDRIVGDAPVAITFDDVYVHPNSSIWSPADWQILVKGLSVIQLDQPTSGVQVHVRWAVLPVPSVLEAWYSRRLAFDHALAIGLDINKDDDGVAREPSWRPKETALNAIDIRHLRVWDGRFTRTTQDGTSGTTVPLIYADLRDMRYEPGPRLLSGEGELFAKSFRDGGIAVDHIIVDAVAHDGDLIFDATGLTTGGNATIRGTIGHLQRRPAVQLDVTVHGLSIEQMVLAATDTQSIIFGRVDGTIEVHAGGEIPRGAAWMDAHLSLRGGLIPLRSHVGGFARDLLRLVPWIELDGEDRMVLGETSVSLRLERGTAIIHELRHQSQTGRWITMHGEIEQEIDAVVRFEPRESPETRAGFGFRIAGAPGDFRITVAKRHELLPSIYADEEGNKLGREERRERRQERRQERRAAALDPVLEPSP